VKCSTYRSATTKCTGKVIRQKFKLPTVLQFVEFSITTALAILSVKVLIRGMGVKTAQGDLNWDYGPLM
jgi:hypothetical protein